MEQMKLDVTDRKILSELDKNCRIPNSLLAKKVSKSREAVKYRIQQLRKRGILTGFITAINPNKLGYYLFKVYLKLENIQEERERFFAALEKKKEIYWLGISDGAFDCVFAILAKSIPGYYRQINNLLSEWEHLIISKILGTMVDTKQYNKKFFLNETGGEYVTFGGDVVQSTIDELDYHILTILANDARIPLTQLARNVSSTIEIVRGRIKKLEKQGVILGYRIAVDFTRLDLEFFKLFVYFRKISAEDERALAEWLRTHPKSLYYIRSLAPWEIEPEFVVENYNEFNAIVNDLRKRFPHVIRNYEHLIMKYETWMPAYREMLKPTAPDT